LTARSLGECCASVSPLGLKPLATRHLRTQLRIDFFPTGARATYFREALPKPLATTGCPSADRRYGQSAQWSMTSLNAPLEMKCRALSRRFHHIALE
jgi:hypothetical protein